MNIVFKLMIFSILLNFSVGIMLNAIVDDSGDNVFDIGTSGGMTFDESYGDDFQQDLNSTVNPSGLLEDKGNAIYRILDTLNLGFIAKFVTAVEKYMYGFVNMLQAMFGAQLGDAEDFIFGTFKVFIGIGYILGAWYLWTGKNLDD